MLDAEQTDLDLVEILFRKFHLTDNGVSSSSLKFFELSVSTFSIGIFVPIISCIGHLKNKHRFFCH